MYLEILATVWFVLWLIKSTKILNRIADAERTTAKENERPSHQ